MTEGNCAEELLQLSRSTEEEYFVAPPGHHTTHVIFKPYVPFGSKEPTLNWHSIKLYLRNITAMCLALSNITMSLERLLGFTKL